MHHLTPKELTAECILIQSTMQAVNTSRPNQIFKCNFFKENVYIWMDTLLNFVSNGPVDNKSTSVEDFAPNPLTEPMMVYIIKPLI